MSTCRRLKKVNIIYKNAFDCVLQFDCQSDEEAEKQNPVRNVLADQRLLSVFENLKRKIIQEYF
jgi:hypothetical protein